MKVSKRVSYGIRALVYLALHYENGIIQNSEVAAHQAIPEPYLEQLMVTLRKAGFVKSKVGPQGGHALAKEPTKISLGEAIVSLEGKSKTPDCLIEPGNCAYSNICAQRDVWQDIEEVTKKMLNSISIGELAKRQLQREEMAMHHM